MTLNKKFIIGISMLIALIITMGAMQKPLAESSSKAVPNTNSKSHVLMDYSTGQILEEKNSFERRQIASMVKIMPLLLTFEEIEAGRLSYDDEIRVSENASSMGGSQAFLDANNDYKVSELIKSIVVASANDSCVAMAEHIGGSVEGFVEKMNQKASSLGLKDTYFVNCTGLPAPNQYSCANDVSILFRELIKHKGFFDFSKIWMFDFAHPSGRTTQLSNTNKLIRAYDGCDGGKTGFTNEAMSCLAATAKRGDTRLISVVVGAPSSKERNAENAALFNYGFANYETKKLVTKDETLPDEIEISGGKEKTITVTPNSDFYYLVNKGAKIDVSIEKVMEVCCAPVSEGAVVGKLVISVGGQKVGEVELRSLNSVKKLSYLDVVDDMIEKW